MEAQKTRYYHWGRYPRNAGPRIALPTPPVILYVSFPFCHVTLRAQKPAAPEYPRQLETLGDHIRKKRLDLGLLQKDVGKIIGVAQGTVMVWEGNRRPIARRLLRRIVWFLGYDPCVSGLSGLGTGEVRSSAISRL